MGNLILFGIVVTSLLVMSLIAYIYTESYIGILLHAKSLASGHVFQCSTPCGSCHTSVLWSTQ